MLKFRASQWRADGLPTIDIEPIDNGFFLPMMVHLMRTYEFPLPQIIDRITGYFADFEIMGGYATLDIDTYDFSIAFATIKVRDRVLADLNALPPDYFQ